MLLGAQSKREVLRARSRALAAMRAQTRDEGRFLGGRPPYGYRLVDAGPHPNPMHAKWGRRLQRYDPDPQTAPTVRWIFAQRLAGRSVSAIARRSTPTACRARRRPTGTATATGAAAVGTDAPSRRSWPTPSTPAGRYGTANPPTTRRAHLPGPFRTQRWASTDQWVISKQLAHPALVSEADFVAAQDVTALPGPQRRRPAAVPAGRSPAVRVVWAAAGVVTGRTAGRRTAASTVTPAPNHEDQTDHTTSTSAKTP